jgi:hypothetical protein
MLDRRGLAIGNVRIDRNLRRRRNDNGNRDRGNVGNISDIGNFDNLRDDGHFGIVGHVRFRLERHCFIVGANLNDVDNAGRRCSNRNSVGIYRDRQSWGQLRSSGTNDQRIAHCGCGGDSTNDAHCFVCGGKH